MSYDTTTTPAADANTLLTDYTRLRDSIKSVRQQCWDLGGSLHLYEAVVAANTYTDLPDGWQLEINGDDLSGLSVFLEINVRGDSGTNVTITVQLYNVTAAAAVASSDVAIVNPGTTPTRGVSAALTLAAGNNIYKARIKRSVTTVGVAAKVRVYTR